MSFPDRDADIRRSLEQIPDLYALAALVLTPASSGHVVVGAPTDSRPPVNLDVLDLLDVREKSDASPVRDDFEIDRLAKARRQGVLPTLASWVRLVDSKLWDEGAEHDPPSEQPTVATECGFLLAHLRWVADQRWSDEIAADLRRIRADLRSALREHDVAEHLTCIRPGCGWDVRPMDGGSWFRCSGCGESWGRIELHKMAERRRPRPLKECADIAGVSVRTLRRAIADGHLRHVAADGSTRLFDMRDVTAVAARERLATRA